MEYDTGRLAELLISCHLTLATAESCTGGLIANIITDRPGSSGYFAGGIIAYSNAVKCSLLGVPAEILEQYGAVSTQVAEAMAAGARKILNTDIAVSATGIAGPTGGSPEKPVGLVFIGIAFGEKVISKKFLFTGEREGIKAETCKEAVKFLVEEIQQRSTSGG